MAYVAKLYETNFLEYASYVIKDRAIPHLDDGLKPVQRRILHSLFEMDDGKFTKVANVVGHCMQYHPHGDASIYEALVVLANKEILIDRQGNFGNIFTGDPPSAARYIECRVLPLAKQILYNPKITTWENSYDDRNEEPVTFPAKVPLVLVLGAEGIAVGMSTRILPHNFIEVLQAVAAAVRGKAFTLYPDFPTGGDMDVSAYEDGNGKVLVRAKLDTSDPRRIVIRGLPFGCTTKSIITSIEAAARKGTIRIAGISDFTTDKVEIEIRLQRGTYAADVVDVLYAFTDCEVSIPVNLLVIRDNVPVQMTVKEVIEYHAKKLVQILQAELKLEQSELLERLHIRTLEQIFVEERIYQKIEEKKTPEAVQKAVLDGFLPFAKQIKREVTPDDVERLLKIPIRRISLYDINKAKKEMEEIRARLAEIKYHLAHLSDYAVSFLDGIIKTHGGNFPRATAIKTFQKIEAREAAVRNLKLRYDEDTGYIGTGVSGGAALFEVSEFDKIIVIRKTGMYTVQNAPEKLFVDKGALFCGFADKEQLASKTFSALYRDPKTDLAYIKRAHIETWILDKAYDLVPEGMELLKLTSKEDAGIHLEYQPGRGLKKLEEVFALKKFPVRGLKAAGIRVSPKKIKNAQFVKAAGKKK
ncbi:MAG: DNA topoisomerase IV subunit A [Spirochaetales bacterium]|jgi:topoisomerase-4 subunit A|nr:DNA topoisomerase IV subunit A [Spirochaetales bacterium]